ncbi:MAG: Glycosyl hydrolase, glucoamylase [Parcubacteria group bacterium GW2011_GWA2_47_7]|nr:MAG: Glycosyl hydrolase, glucoamylase [Parcubacteria group bacterium GW2011_GWA2_47_7]
MAKSLSFGNGSLLICTDHFGRVRDIYYPFIGLENQAGASNAHRIGVWVDGRFSWIDDGSWTVDVQSDLSYTGLTTAHSDSLQIELHFTDVLSHEKNIFLRKIKVLNFASQKREVRIFFNQQFELFHSEKGDTAYYDPQNNTIVHYEGKRAILINANMNGHGFTDYTVGLFHMEGKEGAFKDAEDGVLGKNNIEHGSVDSVIGMTMEIETDSTGVFYYWFTVGESIDETKELNLYVSQHSAEHIMKTSRDYWSAWIERSNWNLYGLSENAINLFLKSQFYLRSHVDVHGGIIASGDSDMLQGGRDTYAYVWPRDAAYVAVALDWIGDRHSARKFFDFCNHVITEGGYMMHKYRPDESLGSSWHGYVVDGHSELPIQEDETALILWALWEHWLVSRDLDFIESLYESFIKKAATFMVAYRDPYTGLPKSSYNLWEEKFGIHTYTASSVYAGLLAAARFADLLGKDRSEHNFHKAANEMRNAILKHLYDAEQGYFLRSSFLDEKGEMAFDRAIDASSAYGIFLFGVLPPDDPRLTGAIARTKEKLSIHTPVGGIARYEEDQYYHVADDVPGNPWFITTLWYTQHAISIAKSDHDLDSARAELNWVERNALRSGILSEQLNPHTGEQLGAAPLTWSHAEYVRTVVMYLDKLKELNIIREIKKPYE